MSHKNSLHYLKAVKEACPRTYILRGGINCPYRSAANDGATVQTNPYQLPEETSNDPNSWVEALYEESSVV